MKKLRVFRTFGVLSTPMMFSSVREKGSTSYTIVPYAPQHSVGFQCQEQQIGFYEESLHSLLFTLQYISMKFDIRRIVLPDINRLGSERRYREPSRNEASAVESTDPAYFTELR